MMAMVMLMGGAALAVDVAGWYVKRHQAQVAADSAALAAANCLSHKACTSTAAGGDAYQVATTYASTNGVPASNITIAGGNVTVTTATQAPIAFAGTFGVHPTVSARAVAAYTVGVTAPASVYGADCTNPTLPPATGASGCTVDCSKHGVTIKPTGGGKTDISGAIETNGSVDLEFNGNVTLGPVQYGEGGGTDCSSGNKVKTGGNASIADGPGEATGFTGFPTTYNDVWTSSTTNMCSTSSTYTGSTYAGYENIAVNGGTSTVPATITLSGNNSTFGSVGTPVVMCASTSITLTGNSATLNDITLVAPSIVITGNTPTITPDPDALPDGGGSPAVAIYDTGTAALDFGTNNIVVTGAVYAPSAGIVMQGNNGGQALIEANTVEIDGNNAGDGPTTTLTAFQGWDQLTQ